MKLFAFISLACLLQVNNVCICPDDNRQYAPDEQAGCRNVFLQLQPAQPGIDSVLNKIYKHRMPILLSEVESVLGKAHQIIKVTHPPQITQYTWETKDGIQYNFEDINYNEKGIELDRLTISSKRVVKHPLGIYLNKSTLAACKKTCTGLKKSLDERTYKFRKNKTWYFLEFNKQNVLDKIKSVDWDTDMSG
jgi:hypothetical protein